MRIFLMRPASTSQKLAVARLRNNSCCKSFVCNFHIDIVIAFIVANFFYRDEFMILRLRGAIINRLGLNY